MSYNGVYRTALTTTSILKSTYIPNFSLNIAQKSKYTLPTNQNIHLTQNFIHFT